MSTPKLYLAYKVPRPDSLVRRGIDRLIKYCHLPPLYRLASDFLVNWKKPVRAPNSISFHLLQEFKKDHRIRFYDVNERTVTRPGTNDIFIGQPLPVGGFDSGRPNDDEKTSVTSRTVREAGGKNVFLMLPYSHDPLYATWAKNLIKDHTGGVIFISGEIWSRNWHLSPFADLPAERRLHIVMGIDPADYPVVKTSFNPKGKRKYLYVGHTAWYKNAIELERIAAAIPGFEGGHIGGGTVKGWKKIADFADLTPEFMKKIAEEYDIFVTVSSGDPQATTVLEQMCFGFAVAVTPETGYEYPSLIRLSVNDTAHNVKVLGELQQTDESLLIAQARENRKIATELHSWDKFTKSVRNFVENYK